MVLNEFSGNRVTEIRSYSNPSQWWHAKSSDNIADIGTRMNATLEDINESSDWQRAPGWLRKEKEKWPISQEVD